MNAKQLTLWERILSFQIDDGKASLPFSTRLATEQKWSADFTQRAILEYKRFIFLCCVLEKGASPSKIVDEVWHLHLTYTHSYWNDFCKNTLGQELHHIPSSGGDAEDDKHRQWYTDTLTQYKRYFNAPPADIWPPPIPVKVPVLPPIKPAFYAIAAILLCLPFLYILFFHNTVNPFHLRGKDFLIFFPLFSLAIVGIEVLVKYYRLPDYKKIAEEYIPGDANPYQLADFAHGRERAIQTGLIGLINRNLVKLDHKVFTINRYNYQPIPNDENPLIAGWENEQRDTVSYKDVRQAWFSPEKTIHPTLRALQSYMNGQMQYRALGLVTILALGIGRCLQGYHNHRPVSLLLEEIVFVVVLLSFVKIVLPSRKSVLIDKIREKYKSGVKEQYALKGPSAIRHFSDGVLILTAFGIYGSDTGSDTGGGSSCGGGGSCGGSSCGGGGCGGCGGGGD